MSPINTFNVPARAEFGQNEIDARFQSMVSHEAPEYAGTILADTPIDGEAYVTTLHEQAYQESLLQERQLSGERPKEKCVQIIEAAAVNVERLRDQYALAG